MSDVFATIATFTTLPEAEAAKLHLESAGIPVNILDAEIVSMDWLLGNAVGYIKLQVPTSRVEAAAQLLESQSDERRRRREEMGDAYDDACLSCGTDMGDASVCPACGWSWVAQPGDTSDESQG